jgi:hypothetical protein
MITTLFFATACKSMEASFGAFDWTIFGRLGHRGIILINAWLVSLYLAFKIGKDMRKR